MMKSNIKYISISLCLFLLFGCSDFLDRYPLDKAVNETYWKTEAQLRAALYPCYEWLQFELITNIGDSSTATVISGDPTSGRSTVGGGTSSAQDNFPIYNPGRDIYGPSIGSNNFQVNYDQADVTQSTTEGYAP